MALTSGTVGPCCDVSLNGRVSQLRHETALPIAADPFGEKGVEGTVQSRVRHRPRHLGHYRGNVAERFHGPLAFVQWPGPLDDRGAEGVAMAFLGDEIEGWGDLEGREGAVRRGRVLDEFPEEPQEVAGPVHLVQEDPNVDVLDRMDLVLKGRHYAKIPAPAAKGPEQVRVLALVGYFYLAVRGDDLGREQVVDG